MQSKLYLLLAVLCVSVICSLSTEQKPDKSDPALDSKKEISTPSRPTDRRKEKQQVLSEVDDETEDHSPLISQTPSRYASLHPAGNSLRGRSRFSAQQPPSAASVFDDFMNGGDEWTRTGFGNLFSGQSSSNSLDNHFSSNNAPACHSLIDSQYPIFADICGAVPQARYALPNSFGHRERWQVAQLLSNIVGSSEDSACLRSLRLLLCPVLFPPCQSRNEQSPVLPCQSYCRAVKARCNLPALELLRCETLPYSSDLCPSNQPSNPYLPSGPQSLSKTSGYQSPNYPPSRSLPSAQSLLSPSSSSFHAPAQSPPSMHYHNNGPMGADVSAMPHNDYPSRAFQKGYRQGSRFVPTARVSSEGRQTFDPRSAFARV